MTWDTRRKLIYALATLLAISAISIYAARDTLFPAPMCTDGKQNGYEVGVDCGGTCALRCTSEVVPLTTKWARPLVTGPSTYDFVALVSNKNIDNAAHMINYSFTAYDARGVMVKQVFGTSTAPTGGDFPIIMQNVSSSKVPTSVTAILFDGPHYKVDESPTSPTLRTSNARFEAGSVPRVYATVTNTKRVIIRDLHVRVLLFDINDNVYAAGETVIPKLDKEESKEISFTWNMPFKNDPTKIRIYPIFDPFSPVQ